MIEYNFDNYKSISEEETEFMPIEEIGNSFSKFIDKYPVTPYLESRQSLVRWTHFIHNKINIKPRVKLAVKEEKVSSALPSLTSNTIPFDSAVSSTV